MVVLGRRQIRGAVWQMMTFSYLLLVCLSACPCKQNRRCPGNREDHEKRGLECT